MTRSRQTPASRLGDELHACLLYTGKRAAFSAALQAMSGPVLPLSDITQSLRVGAPIRDRLAATLLQARGSFTAKAMLPFRLGRILLDWRSRHGWYADVQEVDLGIPRDPLYASPGANEKLQSRSKELERLRDLPARSAGRKTDAASRRLLYVSGMPRGRARSGYNIRTGLIDDALTARGWTVEVVHLGWGMETDSSDTLSDIALPWPHSGSVTDLLITAETAIGDAIARSNPSHVMAGANWLCGWPGLRAAQASGLPFTYDLRGIWSETRAATCPGYGNSLAFATAMAMEARICREAQSVVVLSDGMSARLCNFGVSREKVTITPNVYSAPDLMALKEAATEQGDRLKIGFAGSVTPYEGLDTLIELVAAHPVIGGRKLAFHVAGSGGALVGLEALASIRGVKDQVTFHGRIPHKAVSNFLSEMDVIVYPRHKTPPFDVVPALKPLEPMAIGVPCLFSDIAPHRDLAGPDNGRAWIVIGEGVKAWHDAIREFLLQSETERRQRVHAAHNFVLAERMPDHLGQGYEAALSMTADD